MTFLRYLDDAFGRQPLLGKGGIVVTGSVLTEKFPYACIDGSVLLQCAEASLFENILINSKG